MIRAHESSEVAVSEILELESPGYLTLSCELGASDRLYVFRPSADVRAGARWGGENTKPALRTRESGQAQAFHPTPKIPRGLESYHAMVF